MDKIIKKRVDEKIVNMRLDMALSMLDEKISRSFAKNIIDSSAVLVNGHKEKSGYKLKLNDVIEASIPEAKELNVEAEDIKLDIIYEDECLLVINKPKGMVVHPANGNQEHTLVNAIMFHCKDSLSTINGVIRPGIVHRIDKDTSGLLVVAKDDVSHNFLAKQFSEHSNNRKYIAVVHGNIKDDEGKIDVPIGRSKNDRKKMAVVEDGRSALTHYKVLSRFKDGSVVECKLETGRTHQIRVHMAYIHHPLFGDNVYGIKADKKNGHGQMLCATTLGFIHPKTKKYVEFNIEPPEEFKKYLMN